MVNYQFHAYFIINIYVMTRYDVHFCDEQKEYQLTIKRLNDEIAVLKLKCNDTNEFTMDYFMDCWLDSDRFGVNNKYEDPQMILLL